MLSGNFAEMTTSTPFRGLLHATNLRHGTGGFTSEARRAEDFFALKNPTASAGFEPANLGTVALDHRSRLQSIYSGTNELYYRTLSICFLLLFVICLFLFSSCAAFVIGRMVAFPAH
jgi:hypothetical protein